MSSKREKFYSLCRKLWSAGSAAALATAFFISGNQITTVAYAVDDVVRSSANDITINGETITAPAVLINGEKNVTVSGGSKITADYGNVTAGSDLTVDNSSITHTLTGILEGRTTTLRNGAVVKQGQDSRVTGMTSLNVTGSNVTQGTSGVLEATSGSMIIDGSSVTQGDASSLSTEMINGGSITLKNGSTVSQGDGSKVTSKLAVTLDNGKVTQGNNSRVESLTQAITVSNGGKITQGNNSSVVTAAGQAINLSGGGISQGLSGNILSGGALSFTNNSVVSQLTDGTIRSGAGYGINVNSSTVTQGANGKIQGGSSGAVVLDGATITQGDKGENSSQTTMGITNSIIGQGDDSKITSTGNMTISGATAITQEDRATLSSGGTLSATGGSITQGDSGTIKGNVVNLNGTTITQEKNGTITSDTTMSITGGAITQESGLSVIVANGLTIDGAVINQSVNTTGNGINSRISSAGGTALNINGASKITQGGGGRITGDAGVNINGSQVVITQGDNSLIETAAGQNITLNGTITQGNNSGISTSSASGVKGKLLIQDGTKISQGTNGKLVNADDATMTLTGVVIRQGNNSELRTGGDLVVKNTGTRTDNIVMGHNSLLAAGSGGTITLDNAGVALGAGSKIRLGYVNIQGATEAERNLQKEEAKVGLELTNGSLLNLGGSSSIVSEVNGSDNASAFNKIHVGAGSEIHATGLFTFNNDWVGIDEGGKVTSTGGVIYLTNGSKVYGTGTMISTGLVVTEGSILSPGGNYGKEMGTLHISGPLTVTSTGILEIQTDSNTGKCDLIEVNDYVVRNVDTGEELLRQKGDVVLGDAQMRLTLGGDQILANNVFDIIKIGDDGTGTISGTLGDTDVYSEFGAIPFFDVVERISDDKRTLSVGLERNQYFEALGQTYDQKAAGRMLDQTNLNEQWLGALTYISNLDTVGKQGAALNILSGRVKANSLTLYRETPVRSVLDQFGWNPCGQAFLGNQNRFSANVCQKKAVWATPYHTETKYRDDDNAGAYNVHSTGFLAGINRQLDQMTVFGVFFGYGRPEMSQDYASVDMDDFTFGLTAGTMITSKLELKGLVSGGFQRYSMKRYMNPALLGGGSWNPGSHRLTSDFDGNSLFASLELSRPIYLNTGVVIRPLVAFESENVWQQSFEENGASVYALEFSNTHNDRTFVRTGFTGEVGANNFNLLGRVFYSHQLGGSAYSTTDTRFAQFPPGDYQRVRGVDLNRNFLTLGAGGNFYLNPRKTQTVSVNYDATVSEKSTSQVVYAGFTQLF